MEQNVRETVACPHCGGEVKAAARRCKHCRSEIEVPEASAARAPSVPSAVDVTDVTRDLRALLISRGVLSAVLFDSLATQHPGSDAATMLEHLCAAQHITAVQVEVLREAFREHQIVQLGALLDGAIAHTLLGATHAQRAREGFEPVVFRQSPAQYLIVAQYLTASQVRTLGDRTHQGGAARPSGGAPTNAAVGGTRDVGAWWRAQSAEVRQAIVGISLLVVLVSAFLAVHGSPDIVENATMNGWGHGTATFTNRGSRVGSVCGHVVVRCGRGSRSSASFCSGSVTPNETKRVEFSVTDMDRIGSYVRDWRDDCEFDFIRESTGN